MKEIIAIVLLVFVLYAFAVDADASWLIDEERYHVSAHGQNSCQDCHADIVDRSLHPDPAEVSKSLREFYRLEQCTSCHDDILEDLDEGSHGGENIGDEKEFKFCIGCHDPHYQLSYSDEAAKLDLSQPVEKKCSICHELEKELPEYSEEDQTCMECHAAVAFDDPQASQEIASFCFNCHASKNSGDQGLERYALIDTSAYANTPHAEVACSVCHPRAIEFGHHNQSVGDCRQCHVPHDEKVAHDLHAVVTCEACHLSEVTPQKDRASRLILWDKTRNPNRITSVHQMVLPEKDKSCKSCHVSDNQLGAVAMVMPPKSILCMPCHAATFSAGDGITLSSLVLFMLGLVGVGSVWFSGSRGNSTVGLKFSQAAGRLFRTLASGRIITIFQSLLLDGLLQRRLFRVSRERWLLHALIFYPFVFRFLWGLIGLIASLWWPQWPATWSMLDKNHPWTAFLFDLSGILVLVGVTGMIVRRFQAKSKGSPPGLPAADWPGYALLGSIMIVGYVLEGMRIAMTGSPTGAPWAFVGDAVSRMLTGLELPGIYGYVWYLHALLTGAFVVYLPFSRLFHMLMAPVVLAMHAASSSHN
jgi:nitrate reductase gamma subunit